MVYHRVIDYDQGEQQSEQTYVEHNLPMLTSDQREVYNCFCSMIDGDEGGMFFFGCSR